MGAGMIQKERKKGRKKERKQEVIAKTTESKKNPALKVLRLRYIFRCVDVRVT